MNLLLKRKQDEAKMRKQMGAALLNQFKIQKAVIAAKETEA